MTGDASSKVYGLNENEVLKHATIQPASVPAPTDLVCGFRAVILKTSGNERERHGANEARRASWQGNKKDAQSSPTVLTLSASRLQLASFSFSSASRLPSSLFDTPSRPEKVRKVKRSKGEKASVQYGVTTMSFSVLRKMHPISRHPAVQRRQGPEGGGLTNVLQSQSYLYLCLSTVDASLPPILFAVVINYPPSCPSSPYSHRCSSAAPPLFLPRATPG